jgi:DNA-directed RNA polymerase specialized sigma24 family protein
MLARPGKSLQFVLSRKVFPTHKTIFAAIAEPRHKCGFHYSLCLRASVHMTTPHRYPQFWNIETDASGKPISAAVHLAAHQVWPIVLREVQRRCGDEIEAADLIEKAMLQTSVYLEQLGSAGAVKNMPGLVLTIARRLLRRISRKWPLLMGVEYQNRPSLIVAHWEEQANRAILVGQLVSRLSNEAVRILELRMAEYSWGDIALLLNTTIPAVKNRFWREVGSVKTNTTLPLAGSRMSSRNRQKS